MSARAFRTLGLCTAVALVGCGKAPSVPGEEEPDAGPTVPEEFIPTNNAEHNQMLQGLGFATDLGARTDPVGRPVPDRYHPLKTRFAAFQPRSELYFAGLTFEGEREHLFDDHGKDWGRLDFTGKEDDSWAGANLKNGVGGDFDGDGLDEVFVVYYLDTTKELRYVLLDLSGKAVKEGDLDLSADTVAPLDILLQPALAAGDLDGDGRDEVAVGFSRFYLVDRLEGDPVVTIRAHDGQDSNDAFVAMGNLDWDGEDELVVTYTTGGQKVGRYAIYDGQFETPTQAGTLSLTDPGNQPHSARDSQVAIGDVDGDRLGEIVFGGLVDGNYWGLFILEYNRPTDAPLYNWKSFFYRPGWVNGAIPRPLVLVDYDGDATQEVFFNAYLFEVTKEATPTLVNVGFGSTMHRLAAADMDGDGRDDLIFEWSNQVRVRGWNSLKQWVEKKAWSGTSTPWYSVILAPVNVDGDTPVVRYDGEHELLFTSPKVLAVLASPPYHAGIGQNVDATAATFGKSRGQTVEEEQSLGFTTGFSVGYEADFGIFGGAEFTMTVEQSLDFIAGKSATIEKYHSYTTGPGEDKVVFTTVPFDVYYYTIVSSPAAEDVGRRVSINVPREPQTLSTTREFYNAHNGGSLDVDHTVLQHTPGDVWSYPTRAERDRLLGAAETRESSYRRLWNGPMTVGEGSGYETLGISTTQGSSRGASMEFSVEFEFKAKSPGGATAGTSVGFQYGYSCTYSTEDTAFFEGTVGNIPAPAYTAENRYDFGLFVYPEATGGQKFLVMNWWTEQ